MENDLKRAAELLRLLPINRHTSLNEVIALADLLDALAAQEPVADRLREALTGLLHVADCEGWYAAHTDEIEAARDAIAAPLGPINAHAGKEAEENGAVVDPFLPNAHASTAAFKAAPSQEGVGQGEHGHPAKKLVNGFRNAFRDAGSILGLAAADAHAAQPAEPTENERYVASILPHTRWLDAAPPEQLEQVAQPVSQDQVDAERYRWVRENIDWLTDDDAGIAGCAYSCQIQLAMIGDADHAVLLDMVADAHIESAPVAAPPADAHADKGPAPDCKLIAEIDQYFVKGRLPAIDDADCHRHLSNALPLLERAREALQSRPLLKPILDLAPDAHAIPRQPTDKMLVCGWWKYVGNSNDVHGTCAAIWRAMYDAAPHKAKD